MRVIKNSTRFILIFVAVLFMFGFVKVLGEEGSNLNGLEEPGLNTVTVSENSDIINEKSASFIDSGTEPVQEVEYTGYKFADNDGVILFAQTNYYCEIKPDHQNNGFKTCKPLIGILNTRNEPVSFNMQNLNFLLNINTETHGPTTFEYSPNAEWTGPSLNEFNNPSNPSYNNSVSPEYLRVNEWFPASGQQVQLLPGSLMAIRANFEISQYQEAFYTTTYIPLNFTLDPAVSSCGTLNTANSVYTLTQNVTTSTTCFTITANNITLNLGGYKIDGDGNSLTDYGIVANSRTNITITNGTITDFGAGIIGSGSLFNLNGLSISSNYVGGGGDCQIYGVYLGGNNNIIQHSSISNVKYSIVSSCADTTSYGVFLNTSSTTVLINNVTSNSNQYGFYFLSTSSIDLINSTAKSNSQDGIVVDGGSLSSLFYNNFLNANSRNGLRLISSSFVLLQNSIINASGQDAIYIDGTSLTSIFYNTTIRNTNTNYRDVYFASPDANNTAFIDMKIAKYFFTGVGNILSFTNGGIGVIEFTDRLNGSGSNFSSEISLANNLAFINYSNSGLNKPANITFEGMPANFSHPLIYRNNGVCSPSICTNFTSLNGSIVKIGVTLGGSYRIGEPINSSQAIEIGVNNSLPNNPIRTNYQIYSVDLEGSQYLFAFDKATSLNNQTWAFNYYNEGEEITNMTSLFNALNVWQENSLTFEEIVNQVELFINETRQY